MKNTIKIAFALVFCLMLGVAANAQVFPSGTVSLSVNTSPSFDLRSGGAPTITNADTMTVTGSNTLDGILGVIIAVTDASPNISNATIGIAVPIRLRSNANYKLTATRFNTDLVSATDLDSSDVTMGISFGSRTCGTCGLVEPGSDAQAAGFGGTVAALGAGSTQIASGDRISTSGNTATSNNALNANLNFSVPRQFYTPGTYSNVITVSIAAL